MASERLIGRLDTWRCMVVENGADACLLQHFQTALLQMDVSAEFTTIQERRHLLVAGCHHVDSTRSRDRPNFRRSSSQAGHSLTYSVHATIKTACALTGMRTVLIPTAFSASTSCWVNHVDLRARESSRQDPGNQASVPTHQCFSNCSSAVSGYASTKELNHGQ